MATKQSDLKPKCKYGATCYRRNADHLKAFYHPKRKHDDEDECLYIDDKDDKPQSERKKAKVGDQSDDSSSPERIPVSGKGESYNDKDDKEKDESLQSEPENNDECSSTEDEEEDTVSDEDISVFIKHKFLMDMPTDFYHFWEFCKTEQPSAPEDALRKILGFQLVGPYDILAGKHKGITKNKQGKKPNYLRHWRYYFDPPEFQTVIRGNDEEQFHIGYFRDDPNEMPVFLAANSAKKNAILQPSGDNIFAAVGFFIKEQLKAKDVVKDLKNQLTHLYERLEVKAEELTLTMEVKSKKMKARQKKVVCDTFHMAGLVVPIDENEIGYRELPETPGDLKKILTRIKNSKSESERNVNFDPLQEIITLVQFANDECDYGEGLELGLDLFSFGGKVFHSTILHLLPLAYQLLRRKPFGAIISAHLKCRNDSADLSELE